MYRRPPIVFDELVGDSFVPAGPCGVAGIPALCVVDKKGSISGAALGAVTHEPLRKEIEKSIK